MIKRISVPLLLMSALFITSCGVSKKTHRALEAQYKELGDKYNQSQLDLAESKTRVKSLEEQLEQERKNNAGLREALAKLQGTLDNSINQNRSEEHTSELQSRENLVCRLLLEKKK